MTRRGYPILGPANLRILEVNTSALKPVYLRYEILEVDLRDQYRVRSRARSRVRSRARSRVRSETRIPDISDLRILHYS